MSDNRFIVDLKVEDDDLSRRAIADFADEARGIGGNVRLSPYETAEMQAAGFDSVIVISMDPETIRSIAEYAAGLLLLYKSSDYLGEFFKSVIKKSGEATATKMIDALSRLMRRLYDNLRRARETDPTPGSEKVFRVFINTDLEDRGPTTFSIAIRKSEVLQSTAETFENSFRMAIYRLLPLAVAFETEMEKHERKLAFIRVGYYFAKKPGEGWYHLAVMPISSFNMDGSGRIFPDPLRSFCWKYFRWHPFRSLRIATRGIKLKDVRPIVRKFVR